MSSLLYLASLVQHHFRCICVVAQNTSSFFIAKSYSTVWIDHILFIHSPAGGHLVPLLGSHK